MRYYRIKNTKLGLYWSNSGWSKSGNLYSDMKMAEKQILGGKLGVLMNDCVHEYTKPTPPYGITKQYIDQYDPVDIAIVSFEVNEEVEEKRVRIK